MSTLYDISMSFADDSFFGKCILLIDGTSPLPGWEEHLAGCVEDIKDARNADDDLWRRLRVGRQHSDTPTQQDIR